MSANLLPASTDEKPNMQKQLGCMNGIFQLFGHQHFLAKRRVSGQHHKKLPPGGGQNAKHGMEHNRAADKTPLQEKILEVGKERQRVPVESSRTSFSSTCSSNFSSIECNKIARTESSSFSQSIFPETPSPILPAKQQNSPSHLGRQSLDLRDVVKDSMYREAHGLSVKTMAKEERMGHAMKHRDSPRPLQQYKSVQPRVAGSDGSSRVLTRLREAPWISKEENDGSLLLAPKDTPRFSYDGRESRDKLKSTVKLKELPRLSLDSRERSIRTSASESRSNYLSNNTWRENENTSQILNPNQEPGSNKRPSCVVARLMGLEAFPDPISTIEDQVMKIQPCLDEDFNAITRSSRTGDESKQNQLSRPPRVSQMDPASPQLRNTTSVMKPTSSSRFPLEPAPWKQAVGSRGSQKPAFKNREPPTKTRDAPRSVYGEIEKTELEFKNTGKDLRALKQILEAMQKATERLENNKEEQSVNFNSQTSKYSPYNTSFDQNSKLATQQSQQSNHPISPTIKGTSHPKINGSPIMIIKPAKLTEKPRIPYSSVIPDDGISGLQKLRTGDLADNRKDLVDRLTGKDLTPRNNHPRDPSSRPFPSMDKKTNARTLRSSQSSKAPQQMSGENPTSFESISGTVSPRLQQKKHGMERQSRPTTPSSDSSRARRQSSKQSMESGFPTRKLKSKSTNLQQPSDQSSRFSSETRNLSHNCDSSSVQSESNISFASQIDTGVTSTYYTNESNGTYQSKNPEDKNFAARLSEGRSIAEVASATLEQPSPVSVLDAMFCGEDSLSPVKKISNAFKDEESINCDEAEWNALDIDHLLTRPNLSSEFNHKKLEDIKHLVHNLRLENSTHDEATVDLIASLSGNTTPDHRYSTEILLASGFLEVLGCSMTTIQLHPSGYLINPNLYHALEKTKGSTELANDEYSEKIERSKSNVKIHRKLIFDAVNEILVSKSAMAGSAELWKFPNKLGGISPSGENLLKELWSEIDHLQANQDCSLDNEDDGLISILRADMMNQSNDWADYRGKVPELVLDIERLIFKDLISEVVNGGAAGLQDWPGRHCRQLFSK